MEGVHKKGSKLNACKYRGISKLSAYLGSLRTLLRRICNTAVGRLFPLVNTDL